MAEEIPNSRVQLWEKADLERYLSRHADVVLRLFSEALSLQGRLQAMESRFWTKLEFMPSKTRTDLWEGRSSLDLSELSLFALIANEFANGDIVERPWAAILDEASVINVLNLATCNIPFLYMRSVKAGVDSAILIRSLAYLILRALEFLPPESLKDLLLNAASRSSSEQAPDEILNFLLSPILGQVLAELQDIWGSDCERIMTFSDKH